MTRRHTGFDSLRGIVLPGPAATAARTFYGTDHLLQNGQNVLVAANAFGIQFLAPRAKACTRGLLDVFKSSGSSPDSLHNLGTGDFPTVADHFVGMDHGLAPFRRKSEPFLATPDLRVLASAGVFRFLSTECRGN